MNHELDLVVVGTGPAAGTVARKVAAAGKRVAIVESRRFGGTCALRGCNPKKVYVNAATLSDQAHHARGKLVAGDEIRIDWSQLHEFKRKFTEPVAAKSEERFQDKGIATFHGAAFFRSPTSMGVGEQVLNAKRFVVATGGRPRPLDMPGSELVLDSSEFLDLSELPQQLAFIGGGYISMEFAHVSARYGAEVTIFERGERPLKQFDPDLVAQLAAWSAKHGISIEDEAEVLAIEKADGKLRVKYRQGDQERCQEADLVIHGAGRIPNLDALRLEAGDVAFNDDGIEVDSFLRSSSNARVFAAGDCAASGAPKLTPSANEEARVVVKNLWEDKPRYTPNYGFVPQVAFTVPPIAAIGMSESEATQQIESLDVRHEDTSEWGSVRKTTVQCAAYKILIDKSNDRIVGAHLLGPSADEVINLFALAMRYGLTATDIKATLFAFPTFSSDVRRML